MKKRIRNKLANVAIRKIRQSIDPSKKEWIAYHKVMKIGMKQIIKSANDLPARLAEFNRNITERMKNAFKVDMADINKGVNCHRY